MILLIIDPTSSSIHLIPFRFHSENHSFHLQAPFRHFRAQATGADVSVRWNKAVVILERASKLVLLDPEEASEHTRQWAIYKHTGGAEPTGYLESPRYRVPTEFEETKFALETLIRCCGEDGVFPLDKKLGAELDGREEVVISPAVILFVSRPSGLFPSRHEVIEKTSTDIQHHVIAATQTLLYDTNSLDAENTEALIGARRAVALIKELPPLVRLTLSHLPLLPTVARAASSTSRSCNSMICHISVSFGSPLELG